MIPEKNKNSQGAAEILFGVWSLGMSVYHWQSLKRQSDALETLSDLKEQCLALVA